MEWIEQLQRDLGGPVLQFAQQNWLLLLVAAALGAFWLFGGSFAGRGEANFILGDSESESGGDGVGDGGGGDGGGGGD